MLKISYILKNDSAGLSDLAGFIFLILGLVMIPFLLSFQIFQYYHIQNICYSSAALTLRTVEVGYSNRIAQLEDPTLPAFARDIQKTAMNTEVQEIFRTNMYSQGIRYEEGYNVGDSGLLYLNDFQINTKSETPFINLVINMEMPLKYGGGIFQQDTLPITIDLAGRRTVR